MTKLVASLKGCSKYQTPDGKPCTRNQAFALLANGGKPTAERDGERFTLPPLDPTTRDAAKASLPGCLLAALPTAADKARAVRAVPAATVPAAKPVVPAAAPVAAIAPPASQAEVAKYASLARCSPRCAARLAEWEQAGHIRRTSLGYRVATVATVSAPEPTGRERLAEAFSKQTKTK